MYRFSLQLYWEAGFPHTAVLVHERFFVYIHSVFTVFCCHEQVNVENAEKKLLCIVNIINMHFSDDWVLDLVAWQQDARKRNVYHLFSPCYVLV